MIIFKIYTSKKVRNSQTASENFFEGVLSTLLESAPKKIFIIIRTTSMNFFEGCTHDYFQKYKPQKRFKIAKRLQIIFFEGIFSTLLESAPKKIFIISRTASRNFFEGCTHNYFENIYPKKGSK